MAIASSAGVIAFVKPYYYLEVLNNFENLGYCLQHYYLNFGLVPGLLLYVGSPTCGAGYAANEIEDEDSYFKLNGFECCSMPPFATDFGCSANLMAGKSYFGALTINC